jgi:hypothetical protein
MPKKKPMQGKPVVNKELDGMEIEINEFGEIVRNFPIEKLNKFLDKEVDDKKLAERDDYDEIRKGEGLQKQNKGKQNKDGKDTRGGDPIPL